MNLKIKSFFSSINYRDILSVILIVLLTGTMIYLFQNPKVEYKEKVVEKTRTITINNPVPVNTYISKPVLIPFETEKVIVQNDTTYIVLDREVKEYRDSTYYARISGYDPKLEQLDIYQKTIEKTIEKTIYKKPMVTLSLGATAGYSPIYNNFDAVAGFTIAIPIYSWYFK